MSDRRMPRRPLDALPKNLDILDAGRRATPFYPKRLPPYILG